MRGPSVSTYFRIAVARISFFNPSSTLRIELQLSASVSRGAVIFFSQNILINRIMMSCLLRRGTHWQQRRRPARTHIESAKVWIDAYNENYEPPSPHTFAHPFAYSSAMGGESRGISIMKLIRGKCVCVKRIIRRACANFLCASDQHTGRDVTLFVANTRSRVHVRRVKANGFIFGPSPTLTRMVFNEQIVSVVLTDFVEVERKVAGHRAVEARLQERRPAVAEPMRTALVPLADARHTREDGLRFGRVGLKSAMRKCAWEIVVTDKENAKQNWTFYSNCNCIFFFVVICWSNLLFIKFSILRSCY